MQLSILIMRKCINKRISSTGLFML